MHETAETRTAILTRASGSGFFRLVHYNILVIMGSCTPRTLHVDHSYHSDNAKASKKVQWCASA